VSHAGQQAAAIAMFAGKVSMRLDGGMLLLLIPGGKRARRCSCGHNLTIVIGSAFGGSRVLLEKPGKSLLWRPASPLMALCATVWPATLSCE
jgi:hypothetical protein